MDFKPRAFCNKEGITVAIMTDHPVTRIQDLVICAAFAARRGPGGERKPLRP